MKRYDEGFVARDRTLQTMVWFAARPVRELAMDR
jgi:hypothetical protein